MAHTYKSTSDFRHTVLIQGKKYLVGPGDVISSPTPLSYIFLEKVADNTPVTIKNVYTGNKIQQQVLQQQKEVIETSSSELEQIKQKLESFIDRYDAEMASLTESIDKKLLAASQSDVEFKDQTNRRLSILKDAVRSMEDEVFGANDPNE